MFDNHEIDEAIEKTAQFILSAKKPSVFTGAGVSQESGISTYRQTSGSIWDTVDVDEVGTAFALHLNPKRVWNFWTEQKNKMSLANPNEGHNVLAQIEKKYVAGLPIITQNIDDLHERAGSRNVIHLHGKVSQARCSRYCKGVPSIIPNSELVISQDTQIPSCPYCGELARPDVILFGEYLHAFPIEQANHIVSQTDLMIIVGTSGLVAPASKIPLNAQDRGATLIEINPNHSRITPNVDVYIPLPSAQALTKIVCKIEQYLAS